MTGNIAGSWSVECRFATNADRVTNAEDLRVEIEAVLGSRASADWEKELEAAGVACAPVQRLSQVLASEQARVLGMVQASIDDHLRALYDAKRVLGGSPMLGGPEQIAWMDRLDSLTAV